MGIMCTSGEKFGEMVKAVLYLIRLQAMYLS